MNELLMLFDNVLSGVPVADESLVPGSDEKFSNILIWAYILAA